MISSVTIASISWRRIGNWTAEDGGGFKGGGSKEERVLSTVIVERISRRGKCSDRVLWREGGRKGNILYRIKRKKKVKKVSNWKWGKERKRFFSWEEGRCFRATYFIESCRDFSSGVIIVFSPLFFPLLTLWLIVF